MKCENIMPYLNNEKRLLPRRVDLTYYNWYQIYVPFFFVNDPVTKISARVFIPVKPFYLWFYISW